MDLIPPSNRPKLAAPTSFPAGGVAAAKTSSGDGRLAASARQFGAMFMTEMVRLARPDSKAAGPFKTGTGERSWQIFMDQALGQAAAGQDASSLVTEIQRALEKAQGGTQSEAAGPSLLPPGAEVSL